MYLCDYLSVCLSVCFHLAKIDQTGGPETFLKFCLAQEQNLNEYALLCIP